MGKLIFWFVVILAVLFIARLAGARAASKRAPRAEPAPDAASQPMVRCAHCGVHLPRAEAVLLGGQTWCSSDHARRGADRG
ncbi:putative exported protein [Bordetella bronchiseptica MO211]|nr:putative exported protein [Bordetella bronchiseptica MO211]